MEIDSRRIRRLIRQNRAKERTLDRIVRRQGWLDPLAEAVQPAVGAFYEVLGAPGNQLKHSVHGMTMSLVLVIELVSLGLRLWAPGTHMTAIALATGGWLIALAGAYVGGHLSFGIGTAVNHNAFFDGPMDYVKVGTRDDFPEGEMRRVESEGLPVVIVRQKGLLRAR